MLIHITLIGFLKLVNNVTKTINFRNTKLKINNYAYSSSVSSKSWVAGVNYTCTISLCSGAIAKFAFQKSIPTYNFVNPPGTNGYNGDFIAGNSSFNTINKNMNLPFLM